MSIYESQAPTARGQPHVRPFWRRLWPFGAGSVREQTVARLYAAIVARSRRPEDYRDCGLLDTLDNRREWLGCWAALVMIRLHRIDGSGTSLAQALFDRAFADLEENFREQGVADMSIGKHVKKAAATFLARYKVIEAAIDEGSEELLVDSIARQMAFQDSPRAGADQLTRMLAESYVRMASLSDDVVLAGEVEGALA